MTAAMLLEFAWKSGLLAGAALFGAALLRDRPAAERVVVLRLGVVMIVALPVLALLMPALRLDVPGLAAPAGGTIPAIAGVLAPSRPDAIAASPVARPVAPPVAAAVPPAPAPRPVAPAWRIDAGPVAVAVWALGAALLLFRLGAGVAALHRWTRRAEPVRDPRWLSALDRAAPDGARPVLRASSRVSSPLSWGVRPAVILLNADALGQAGRADAILTHEMGHVRHGDWLFLMLARLLVALLWFNPLVWLLHRELAHQSEQAADAWAVRRIDRTDYATALVAMAARRRPHAALAMAAPRGELARRVTAIMTRSTGRGRPWPTALAIAGCVGLATPLAALEMAPRTLVPGDVSSALPPRSDAPGIVPSAPFAPRPTPDRREPADDAPPAIATGDVTVPDVEDVTASDVEVNAGGAIRPPDGGQTSTAGTDRAPEDHPFASVAVQVQLGSPPWDKLAHIDAQRLAAEEAMRQAARQHAENMREGSRRLRQGAAEMDAGADEVQRSAAATAEPARRRDLLNRASELRRQADDLRREAGAMDADADANTDR